MSFVVNQVQSTGWIATALPENKNPRFDAGVIRSAPDNGAWIEVILAVAEVFTCIPRSLSSIIASIR